MNDVDIRKAIQAKSDRLNADDLIGGSITVTIENVTAGNSESPVAVYYTGCNGKPWYPAKTVLKAIVAAWTDVGKDWVGKSLTLYRDPEVVYGGVKVGGIRVSHFSHIDADFVLMLAEKRGKKKQFSFKKLVVSSSDTHQQTQGQPPQQSPEVTLDEELAAATKALRGAKTEAALDKIVASSRFTTLKTALGNRAHELQAVVDEVGYKFASEVVNEEVDF